MEKRDWILFFLLWFILSNTGCRNSREVVYEHSDDQIEAYVNSILEFYSDKYGQYLTEVDDSTRFPRTVRDEEVVYTGSSAWTSGFFPGILWYLYKDTGDDSFKDAARKWTNSLYQEKNNTSTHDIGFIMNCSYGLGFKFTGDTSYKKPLIEASESLASRYNGEIGMIKSLDDFEN